MFVVVQWEVFRSEKSGRGYFDNKEEHLIIFVGLVKVTW